jgi:protoporphyrinogen oxidase
MKKIEHYEVLIIGAGIAGLAAAKSCLEKQKHFQVLEANSKLGGILRNFKIDEFTFDHAVHLSFATEHEVREEFDKTLYHDVEPIAQCIADGSWFKHPIQNNLHPISVDEKIECISNFLNRPKYDESNFKNWLVSQYGEKIAQKYHIRYNQKYWDTDLSNMSTNWISNRLRQPDFLEILEGTYHERASNDYYIKSMRYPDTGGYQAFIGSLINQVLPYSSLGDPVVKISPSKKIVTTKSGRQIGYTSLISTIPLPVYVKLIEELPHNIANDCRKLKWTTVDLTSVAISREVDFPLWFYIYDEDIFAARCHSPSQKSKNNAPKGCSSIQFEVYTSQNIDCVGQNLRHSKKDQIDNAEYFLRTRLSVQAQDIRFFDFRSIRFGNVIFEHDTSNSVANIRGWLADHSIQTCGRFGEWEYLWSNQAYISGLNAIKK